MMVQATQLLKHATPLVSLVTQQVSTVRPVKLVSLSLQILVFVLMIVTLAMDPHA